MSDNLTPSQRIIADAAKAVELTDALGRKLQVRKLTALDQLKLYRAIGAAHSANQQVFWMSSAAASVSHIDGLRMKFPTTQDDIDDLVGRLGDEGLATVMVSQAREMEAVRKAAEAAADGDEGSGPLA